MRTSRLSPAKPLIDRGIVLAPGFDESEKITAVHCTVAIEVDDGHIQRLHLHPAIDGFPAQRPGIESERPIGRPIVDDGDLRRLGHRLPSRPAPTFDLMADDIRADDQFRFVDIEWKSHAAQVGTRRAPEAEAIGRLDVDPFAGSS